MPKGGGRRRGEENTDVGAGETGDALAIKLPDARAGWKLTLPL